MNSALPPPGRIHLIHLAVEGPKNRSCGRELLDSHRPAYRRMNLVMPGAYGAGKFVRRVPACDRGRPEQGGDGHLGIRVLQGGAWLTVAERLHAEEFGRDGRARVP